MRNTEASENQLVNRAVHGDGAAFHRLVDLHAQHLFRTAYAMTGRRADAEDVVQETLLAAYRGIGHFQGRSAFRTWLVAILIKQVLMLRRRNQGKSMPSLEQVEVEAKGRADPGAGEVDARLDVAQVLRELSEEHREVLVLREYDGMSYDEIAEALEIPRGTVESRLYRARQELKARLPGYE